MASTRTGRSLPVKTCPDCQVPLNPIKIVDQKGHGLVDVGFHYTRSKHPKTSAWSGKMTNSEGTIQAYLCDGCGRVLFYAAVAD